MSLVQTAEPIEATPWNILIVRPQYEIRVGQALTDREIENYVPTRTAVHQWSDRRRAVCVPLFSGYVFARFEPIRRLDVLKTPAVSDLLHFGRFAEPAELTTAEVETIRQIAESGYSVQPEPYSVTYEAGDRVRILRGPLAGIVGTFEQSAAKPPRVIVRVPMLGRALAIEFDRGEIEPF